MSVEQSGVTEERVESLGASVITEVRKLSAIEIIAGAAFMVSFLFAFYWAVVGLCLMGR